MKNRMRIYSFFSILVLVLASCTKDGGSDARLIKKLVEISSDGSSITTLFAYNGNEIVKADNELQHVEYSYTNGLITKISSKNKATQLTVVEEFLYDKDQLVSVKSSDNFMIKYTYNADETVSYQKTKLNDKKEEIKVYHGVLYFKDKNLIKDKRTLDDSPAGTVSTYNVSYEYDLQKNSFFNILGFDKLLDHNDLISVNNSYIGVVESNVMSTDDQISSSANFYKSIFVYDEEGYPIEKVAEATMPTHGKSGYLKTQYFYE